MNQTRKNLLSYSNSGIHSLELVQKARLNTSDFIELADLLMPVITPYVLKHTVSIIVPKGYEKENILSHPTKKACHDFLVVLARLLEDAQHNHIKLSDKTQFVVEISDRLDNFNLHHHVDPELTKIQHMSTAELEKHVRELGEY